MFAMVWIFYAWISVSFQLFHISVMDALFAFSCQVFFFLNKGFSNELGFPVCKGREITLFTKLMDLWFRIGGIAKLCRLLIQSFKIFF